MKENKVEPQQDDDLCTMNTHMYVVESPLIHTVFVIKYIIMPSLVDLGGGRGDWKIPLGTKKGGA